MNVLLDTEDYWRLHKGDRADVDTWLDRAGLRGCKVVSVRLLDESGRRLEVEMLDVFETRRAREWRTTKAVHRTDQPFPIHVLASSG